MFDKFNFKFFNGFRYPKVSDFWTNTLIDYAKVVIISILVFLGYYYNIGAIDLTILFFGLMSFFYVLDSRLAASVALAGLVLCPLLLFRKNDALAEKVATKVYYFLVITVATQLRELQRDENTKSDSQGLKDEEKIEDEKEIIVEQSDEEKENKIILKEKAKAQKTLVKKTAKKKK